MPHVCVVVLPSEIREDKVPGDRFEECRGSLRLGAQTLSQIHGLQGTSFFCKQNQRSISVDYLLIFSVPPINPLPFKTVICRPSTQACPGRPDSGGRPEAESHLRVLCWLPCYRCGLRKQLRHLYPRSCELCCAAFGEQWKPAEAHPLCVLNRSKAKWPHMPLCSCPTQTAWRCCCATRMRAFTSTPTDAS